MKAVVQDRFGPPDVLKVADTGLPEAGPGDVLVRVHAAALNPADWHILRGDPLVARLMGVGLTRPKARLAGIDAAGVVEAAGGDVRGLRNGDEVLGFCRAPSRVRVRRGGHGGAQTGQPDLRAGGRGPGSGDHGPARDPRRGRGEGRSAGARQRSRRRGGHLRRPDRGGTGRRGDRGVQHGQRRAGALDRRHARH